MSREEQSICGAKFVSKGQIVRVTSPELSAKAKILEEGNSRYQSKWQLENLLEQG